MMLTVLLAALAIALLMLTLRSASRRRVGAAAIALSACMIVGRLATYAHADDAGAPAAAVDVDAGVAPAPAGIATSPGSGAASGSAIVPAPAPTTTGGVWDRLVSDWHDGKLLDAILLALFGLVMLAQKAPVVGPWLSQGKRAALIAAATMALTTGIATLASKTVTLDWLIGALTPAVLLYLHPSGTQAAQANAAAVAAAK